jgi:hypothetical protein
MMGVLVHRSFPKEKSNGVVITKNIYRNDYPGFVINAQFGDVSVVRPPENMICEQLICNATNLTHNSPKKLSVKYISKSNLQEGDVLNRQELEKLYSTVEWISQYYFRKTVYVDIEFKFDENGQLYIKQVRPYRWSFIYYIYKQQRVLIGYLLHLFQKKHLFLCYANFYDYN